MRELFGAPRSGVNWNDPSRLRGDHMVADDHYFSMHNNDFVEVVQDEESREPESRAPKWKRNPGIQAIIIPRRGIVRNNRRTLIVVIIVNYLGL